MFETGMVGKADEIFSQFPKSTELLRKWTKKNLIKFYTKMNAENATVEIAEPIILMGMKSTIEVLPRNLYEFFDENEIHIHITFTNYLKGTKYHFSFKEDFEEGDRDEVFNSRQEAEKQAFMDAFIDLEDKIIGEKLNG